MPLSGFNLELHNYMWEVKEHARRVEQELAIVLRRTRSEYFKDKIRESLRQTKAIRDKSERIRDKVIRSAEKK